MKRSENINEKTIQYIVIDMEFNEGSLYHMYRWRWLDDQPT